MDTKKYLQIIACVASTMGMFGLSEASPVQVGETLAKCIDDAHKKFEKRRDHDCIDFAQDNTRLYDLCIKWDLGVLREDIRICEHHHSENVAP